MRKAFATTLAALAEKDARILLLTGDLGYMALEPFSEKFPRRFFNVGVAEQNMIGIATGLAEAGFIPFVYSITTFATLRPYEFIRNGPVLHRLPVRVAGVGGGFEYGHAGPTHHGLEDVGVMRLQPGLSVVAPADHAQAKTALLSTWNLPGPVFYRLGKDDKSVVPGLDGRFDLGRLQLIREGKDLLWIAMGSVATEAAAAADLLARDGVSSTVAILASVQPAPAADLEALLARFPLALTVEAHYVVGGAGSLAAEIIAEKGLGCRLLRCGVRGAPEPIGGSQDFLHGMHGLSRDSLVATAKHALHLART
ncbi:MAG TPA: transketolase C-terminal domain-containing protein [Thermoanaerobaculia bacterium]